MKLFNRENRFNLANLITFGNIACGVLALYFIQQSQFFIAIVLAWIAGGLDIADGKVARKFNLSTEFGVQLDSFADFLSFVIMPSFLLFYSLNITSEIEKIVIGVVFIFYIISGLRRLVEFNLKVDVGEVEKFFEGVPNSSRSNTVVDFISSTPLFWSHLKCLDYCSISFSSRLVFKLKNKDSSPIIRKI